ncbi:MAG: U32 family peptidase [Bacilli bacterium]|nr:U32 family peptidase [Bacilli bacterium]
MDKILNKPELLAPAGNIEKLKWAIKYGADAVYIGGQNYGLRANNDNFSLDDIKEACIYAHNNNAKVYVTVNIVFHNKDVVGLEIYLKELQNRGVDAIIISDPLVLDLIKAKHLNIKVFLSTQQSTINYEAVRFWEKEGVQRIILAREASGTDMKEIIDKTKMDIEVFIHGAMCVGYSGRCTLSNYFTMRDSNRGGCSQICRWNFELRNNKDVKADEDFAISPKDLSLLKYLPDLIKMGIKSFKIEGRMRSIYYIATIIRIYRKAIDEYCNNPDTYQYNLAYENELYRCANRDSVPQYFDKPPGINEQYYTGREELTNKDFIGVVLDYDDINKEIVIQQRNYFKPGDQVEIFGPNQDTIELVIKYIKDIKGDLIDAARHPEEIVRIPYDLKVEKDSLMRTKISI